MADPVGGSEVMSQNGVSSHVDGFLGPLKICWAYPPCKPRGHFNPAPAPAWPQEKGKSLSHTFPCTPFSSQESETALQFGLTLSFSLLLETGQNFGGIYVEELSLTRIKRTDSRPNPAIHWHCVSKGCHCSSLGLSFFICKMKVVH